MRLGNRLDRLEQAADGGKWRCYAIPLYEDDTDEEALAAYEAEHGPVEDGPRVQVVFLREFRNRGDTDSA